MLSFPRYKSVRYIFSLFSAPTRSKFYVREPPNAKPNWLEVGLTLGTTIFLWVYVSTLPIGFSGAGITNTCELAVVGLGNQTWVLREQYMLLTVQPQLYIHF